MRTYLYYCSLLFVFKIILILLGAKLGISSGLRNSGFPPFLGQHVRLTHTKSVDNVEHYLSEVVEITCGYNDTIAHALSV